MLGTLTKPYGTKGSLLLRIKDLKAEEIKEWASVFVEIDGLLVPFFIGNFQIKSLDSLILKFEGINSETKARELAMYNVYVRKDQVKRHKKSVKNISGIHGYRVMDRKLGFIGIAGEIMDLAKNPLLIVNIENRELLIPVHEDIIIEINEKDKVINIDAPDGLFEL